MDYHMQRSGGMAQTTLRQASIPLTQQWIYNGKFMAQADPSKLCRARIARDTVLALT